MRLEWKCSISGLSKLQAFPILLSPSRDRPLGLLRHAGKSWTRRGRELAIIGFMLRVCLLMKARDGQQQAAFPVLADGMP